MRREVPTHETAKRSWSAIEEDVCLLDLVWRRIEIRGFGDWSVGFTLHPHPRNREMRNNLWGVGHVHSVVVA